MPIHRDRRHLYLTPEWASTRILILNRAHHCCEQCRKPRDTPVYTYTWQTWELDGIGRRRVYHMVWALVTGRGTWHDQSGRILPRDRWPAPGLPRLIRVQLGVAHLDPAGPFYSASNLRLLCTWCHLHQDAPQHKIARSMRKDRGRPILAQEHVA